MFQKELFSERMLLLGGMSFAGDEEEASGGGVSFKRREVCATRGSLLRLHFHLTERQSRFELILAESEPGCFRKNPLKILPRVRVSRHCGARSRSRNSELESGLRILTAGRRAGQAIYLFFGFSSLVLCEKSPHQHCLCHKFVVG